METEETLSPRESLHLIEEVVARTRQNIAQNSFRFLLWGWLITIASFSYFLLQQYTSVSYYFLPFPALVAIGILTTVVHHRRTNAWETQTYLDHYLGKMWMVLGCGFLLVVFINVSQNTVPFTYTLLLAGLGTLVSGLVLRFKPLTAGGILLLVSALASLYVQESHKVLLHGVAILGGYLVPGYWLKKVKAR